MWLHNDPRLFSATHDERINPPDFLLRFGAGFSYLAHRYLVSLWYMCFIDAVGLGGTPC